MGGEQMAIMRQTITIEWNSMETMPKEEGTYLVAFDDGYVETYPMSEQDLRTGIIQDGYSRGVLWAFPIMAPKT